MESDYRKYLKELKSAQSDEIAPGIPGELGRLAHLAAHAQGPAERREVVRVLLDKGAELNVNVERIAKAIL